MELSNIVAPDDEPNPKKGFLAFKMHKERNS